MRDLHVYCAFSRNNFTQFTQAEDGTVGIAPRRADAEPREDDEVILTPRKVDRLIAWLTEARSKMVDKDRDPEVA